MIVTITVNPSVDKLYKITKLIPNSLNRVKVEKKMVGGKGINAARVASLLGTPTVATGFIGGQNGNFILKEADNDKYLSGFIETNKETRNCLTIVDECDKKTEINENGLPLSPTYYQKLKDKIIKTIKECDISAISINGSLPEGLDYNFYIELINAIRTANSNCKVLVDSSGNIINSLLSQNCIPDIIKPNEHEIAEYLNIPVTTNIDILLSHLCNDKKLEKIPLIFISLGSKGALIKHNKEYYFASNKPITPINTEGSGDSMVGGILSGIDKKFDIERVIKNACAAGTANALNIKTGYINVETFNKVKNEINISKLK
ncbi:1-phosphofructokinase family hexose kinase [Lactobacillus mulieris]|jgi:tagatose-6-phosphate kinase|uniref:1-phosphofructokinase family hexose kinase n=1 Tax=Lactobacillus TaxID=1578 RepID=UPI001179BD88|nr:MULTISPECIES: 1-phosphofructokinase family hexose kinase [Lactobacillus]KAA9243619.1 1-phosphofructokinase family hexose kinase [Lactobacillus jensenii]MCW8124293.1 1-phosphofructokinase family hexose kinase [Lactobacillus mulieris]MCZ9599349.1 1-phosphofructokinase family hexose kinase [Lactobacillus mulieris]MDK7327508.1 1-phosphofructokinase family hexose kinase [Lactobacillus mulieris]TRT38353.1 1-phosphofructokinase family hexose kinase [Lactobacillus sp. c10Ua232AE]